MDNTNMTMPAAKPTLSISSMTEAGACRKARSYQFQEKETTQPANYFRAIVIKETIKNALRYGVKNPKDIMQYMMTRYAECGFKNFQQKQAQLAYDHKMVMRYLKSEPRKPVYVKPEVIVIGGKNYRVSADLAFAIGKQIELVIMKIGKPTVTQTGRNNQFTRDMQLYALILYGRKLGYTNITASFYFLKKDSDSTDWNRNETSFFGGGGNIVTMTDIWDGKPNQLDEQMNKMVDTLENGIPEEEENEKTCAYCRYFDICKYTLPPVPVDLDQKPETAAEKPVVFSPEQQAAIDFPEGVARSIAGAGSGKTKTVAARVEHLIEEGNAPESICCMTFTKAGAGEMLRRIEKDLGRKLPGITISTFNAFENAIVIDQWKELGFARPPKVIDDVERYAIIADLLNKNPIYEWTGNSFLNFTTHGGWGQKGALRIASDVFTAAKKAIAENGTATVGDVHSAANGDIPDSALAKLISLYKIYDSDMKTKGLLDFDDQELLAFRVFEQNPEYLAGKYKFAHIIVDEFQDTSLGQIELIKKLKALPTFKSLMVVGDDSQSIFGFRNTSPEYIIHFEDYIGEKVTDIYLEKNYRSTPEIIGFANAINDLNYNKTDKKLIAVRDHGMPVVVNGFYRKQDEYEFIAKNIRQHLDAGRNPSDIAVIAYTKEELLGIADVLTKAQIPAMFGAPQPLMENSRIQAILAFARVLLDPADTHDAAIAANALMGGGLMDLPDSDSEAKIDEVTAKAEELRAELSDQKKKDGFMNFIDMVSMQDEAVEHFKEGFANKTYDECITYCRDFSLYGDGVEYRRIKEYPGVVLVTAHSSKGLEWPVVYNTITKYQKEEMTAGAIEEVHRLFFVSATRARDELYVSGLYATGSEREGRTYNRFLEEAFTITGRNWAPDFETQRIIRKSKKK